MVKIADQTYHQGSFHKHPFKENLCPFTGRAYAMTIAFLTHEGREGSSVGKHCLTKAFHRILSSLKVCNDSIGW